MTEQKDKFILDATAGFRMMWFNKHHPNCIYLDQRPECEPDIVGDFRDLKQFPDETFRMIVFDPPHLLRNSKDINKANMLRQFGFLEPETWQSDLTKAFNELWRILKPYGTLIFKWSSYHIASSDVLKLCSYSPLFYQVSTNKKNSYEKGKRLREIQTLWFCFMKIPEEVKV